MLKFITNSSEFQIHRVFAENMHLWKKKFDILVYDRYGYQLYKYLNIAPIVFRM